MARYVDIHPDNPQARLVSQVADALRDDALIAYPTDSGYALGSRLDNRDGRDRIVRIRELDDKHHFTLMCADFAQLGQFVHVSNTAFRAVRALTPGPYTFILPASKEVPRLLKSRKDTVGLRIPDNVIARCIVKELGHPILSVSLPGDKVEDYTDPELIYRNFEKQVDVVIDGGVGGVVPSTIIDCTGEEPVMTRQGAGAWETVH